MWHLQKVENISVPIKSQSEVHLESNFSYSLLQPKVHMSYVWALMFYWALA